jgi:hypothetical protein
MINNCPFQKMNQQIGKNIYGCLKKLDEKDYAGISNKIENALAVRLENMEVEFKRTD